MASWLYPASIWSRRHTKPNPQAGVAGGIVESEAPIQASNVAIYNNATNKADRIGFRGEDGEESTYFQI